jgi:hypothetical protein
MAGLDGKAEIEARLKNAAEARPTALGWRSA